MHSEFVSEYQKYHSQRALSLLTQREKVTGIVGNPDERQVKEWLDDLINPDFDKLLRPKPEERLTVDNHLKAFIKFLESSDYSLPTLTCNYLFDRFVTRYLDAQEAALVAKKLSRFVLYHDVCYGGLRVLNAVSVAQEQSNQNGDSRERVITVIEDMNLTSPSIVSETPFLKFDSQHTRYGDLFRDDPTGLSSIKEALDNLKAPYDRVRYPTTFPFIVREWVIPGAEFALQYYEVIYKKLGEFSTSK